MARAGTAPQTLFFSAETANAFTTVFAGFAFTTIVLPNMTWEETFHTPLPPGSNF